ncbi:alpha/beta fold hydrolase [Pedobacter sp. LMG 31464]|uniref:Alpha/beta fold hydrolase n=1 Tax=Pedobacter planticolens TaxID=2679964 RepID=A0A923E0I8_9SPHI|nr:alpha/beta fold hydrolase [Pedobacter planticolens]MBB2146486.1 alpha/beta fold hydrolase [Pedobacter planticolens]
MKKTILLIALLFISTVSFSQNVLSLFGKANQFFTLLEDGKFDTAHSYFAESEQSKISVDNLKQLWTSVKTKLGKTESLEAIQSKVQGQFFVVIVNGKFEKDEQDFMLAFDKTEKMVGLFMAPKAVVYAKPSYADTTLYQEKSVYLQTPGHQLAAVITTPKNVKNFPIVVLVHGSGPGDMDETVGPNKPFKDIALGLASKGIATVRYVKRTVIYQNEFTKAFTVKEEVTDDALAAVALAKTVQGADVKNVYLMGHSLGGMLAPRLATMAPDLKGIILAAAPARKLTDIILDQNKYMFELAKDTTQATKTILQEATTTIEKSRISQLGNMKPDSLVIGLPASYWVDLNSYDQVAVAKKLKQRILVFQGGNDFQVAMADYNLWNTALGKKSNATLKLYPELNHLMSPQTEKGTTAQYQVPVNVSEKLIDDIAAWIKAK